MATDHRDIDGPEYDYFDAADDEEQGSRGPVFAVVGLIVLVAFMGVVWVAYHQGVRNGRQQPPLIVADSGPVKEVPADTGAAPAPESPALNALGGEQPKAPEVLMPPPETPISPPEEPADTAMSTPAPAPAVSPEADEPAADATPAPKPAVATPAPAPEPVSTPAPAPAAAPAAVAAGDYLVQIAAFRSDAEAQAAWTKLKGKNEDLLGSYSPNVMQADLGAKGIYFRLRFGPFSTRDDAISVCESLKARKQDCLVVKAS